MSGNRDIIYIDDSPGIPGLIGTHLDRIVIVNDPAHALPADLPILLKTANLLIVDYFLDESARDLSRSENGLSELMKLRQKPVAALVSNDLQDALQEPILAARRHVLAARNGVAWVADKTDPGTASELLAIADASARIRAICGETNVDSFERVLKNALSFPSDYEWSATAERHLDRARPPHPPAPSISTVAAASREIITWLLHKIMPFPSLLIESRHVALRLGVKNDWLQKLLKSEQRSKLTETLKAAEYTGVLSNYQGRRWWWRAAVDYFVWSCSSGTQPYKAALSEAAATKPRFLKEENPVIVSDADLVETDAVAEASDCVRALDESFPPEVPPAWVKIADVLGDASLREKILFEDRPVLSRLMGGGSKP